MHFTIVIAAFVALVASTTAETSLPDGTYIQHFTTSGNSLVPTKRIPHLGNRPHGFGVQTGYEGYLIPAKTESSESSGWGWHRGIAGVFPIAKLILKLPGVVTGLMVFGIVALLIGGSLFCHFTHFCGFSLLGLGRTYLTPDSLNSATAFVMDAIEKHRELQKKPIAKESMESKDTKEE